MGLRTKIEFEPVSKITADRTFSALSLYFLGAIALSIGLRMWPNPWLAQFAFQGILFVMLVLVWRSGWRPLLEVTTRAVVQFLGVVFIYILGLWILNAICRAGGYTAEGATFEKNYSHLVLSLLLAPLLEEAFFRDALLRSMRQRISKPWVVIIVGGCFFMLAHLNLYPGAFLLGLVSGSLYATTRTLWPSVGLHMIANGSLYLIPAFFPNLLAALERWNLLRVFYQ